MHMGNALGTKEDTATLARRLAERVRYGRITSEALNVVSRVDAVCWLMMNTEAALTSRKDILTFATVFRGKTSNAKTVVEGYALNGCYSLLNLAYGGVSVNFDGRPMNTWYRNNENAYKHYGAIAPLFRVSKAQYALTLGGIMRAMRVQRLLDKQDK